MARTIQNPKELILSVTKELIEAEGLSNLNMRKVAAQCDIALGTIYNYYPTKMDLIINILENFWIECFSSFNIMENNADLDFFEHMKLLYFHVLEYLEKFKNNWLNDLTTLSSKSKTKGKKKEEEYTGRLLSMFGMLFEKHKDEFNKSTVDNIDRKKLNEFIYVNFISMLRKYERDYSFFDFVLKKLLL